MDDAISRQAVLKLLSTMPPEEAMTKALLIQSVKQMDAPDNLVKDSQGLAKDLVNDCISRQAAIDAIVNTVSEIGLHDNSEVARYGATFMQHEIIDIIEGMPSAQPKSYREGYQAGFKDAQPEQRWIPCSERLPEKNCRCLTTNTAWGAFEVDWNVWINGEWLYQNEKPIAWMPMPEPYKGEEYE